jgi:prophage maintenance system killer protein
MLEKTIVEKVAYVAALTFLLLNGWDFSADLEEKYVTMPSLAEGKLSEEAITQWVSRASTKSAILKA